MISGKERRGKKKMPDAKLSQHPESVKRRRRVAGLDPIAAAVDKAKNADRAARRYARNRVRASDAFRRATVEKQREMVKEAEERVIRKRLVQLRCLVAMRVAITFTLGDTWLLHFRLS
jgi:hypothetical protein